MVRINERETGMANEKKIDCVILGLLSHEELTGYEIKKRMDTTLKYFWSASYGSIYPALSDLVNRGLATKREDSENKRNKRIYTITDEGRSYLKKWLTLPVEKDELRYETLLKIFFGNEQDTNHKYYLITVEFGIKTYHTYLGWCEEAKKLLLDYGA